MDGYGLKVGGAFDLITFLKQPITVLRLFSWVFALVVVASISNEGFINRPDSPQEFCIFNEDPAPCRLGEWAGSLALIFSSAYICLDLLLPRISSVKEKRRLVLSDILLSGLWSLLWFASFCVLAHQWQLTSVEDLPLNEGANAARAAILFCFFSIFSWGGLVLLSLEKMKRVSFEEEYNKLFTPQT